MRRKYFGLAIAAFAAFGPTQAWGDDREIAEEIIKRLKSNRDSGALKDFTLDMKVDQGVVAFRGSVSEDAHKQLVLSTADGVEGVARIVDEVTIKAAADPVMLPEVVEEEQATVAKETQAEAPAAAEPQEFSFRKALLEKVEAPIEESAAVMPVSAEGEKLAADDVAIVSSVISALTQAKEAGQLRGFGVDVKSHKGIVELVGRASSEAQRNTIIALAEGSEGVAGVRQSIAVPTAVQTQQAPVLFGEVMTTALSPVAVDPVISPARKSSVPAVASSAIPVPFDMSQNSAMTRTVANFTQASGPVAGQPVPMSPSAPPGAPRYDNPNLPNYAWPGYAAHPNYASVTYPQQYDASAWPFIGPFYPYPQVPLGWRRVSLEWDDGWWYLDFTDR